MNLLSDIPAPEELSRHVWCAWGKSLNARRYWVTPNNPLNRDRLNRRVVSPAR